MGRRITELRQRNVFKVAATYLVVGWVALQLGTLLFANFGAPAWVPKAFTVLIFLGFPVACVLAWALELTPHGIRVTDGNGETRDILEQPDGILHGNVVHMGQPARALPVLGGAAPSEPAASAHRTVASGTEGPAIAVLPLNNMSGDPEQEFFVDGITEDIITELSRFRELIVISRNSSFKYKGQPIEVNKVAAELRVQYVVEGSVRKAGKHIRLTVQLIDAETDTHVWAERYDRELADIFAIQDELTSAIVSILRGRIEAASGERAARKTTTNLAAYECVLTGKRLHHRNSRADNIQALAMLDRAIELDATYAHAHAWRGCTLGQAWTNDWSADPQATLAEVLHSMRTALSLDENDSDVHRILAAVYLVQHQHERCLRHQQRARDLNPNDDLIVVQQGEILTWQGKADEGVEWVLKAMRLNPYHPERFWNHLGRAYFTARRYDEAADAMRHISAPTGGQFAVIAGCLAQMGDMQGAAEQAGNTVRNEPDFSTSQFLKTLYYFNDSDSAHMSASLLKAGVPP